MRRLGRSLLSLGVLLAVGCDGTPAPMDAGTEDSGMVMEDAGTDAGPMMTDDGNNSFADADPITVGAMDPTTERIGRPGDRDYFTFDGTEGDWISITTDANPDDNLDEVDTVITLFDASMTMIAENDDSVPRANTDSEIITRLPATGTYYILVQEFTQWQNMMPFEGEDTTAYEYDLEVFQIDPAAMAVNVDAEGGDDVASAQALGYNAGMQIDFGLVLGDVRDDADVDVYSFSTTDRNNISFQVMPEGTTGYGSTTLPARMWITDAAGTEIIARVDTSSIDDVQPNLPAGDYNLFVENGGAPGANGFYVIKAIRGSVDNPPEDNDVTNNLPVSPEVLTLMADADGVRRAFRLLDLPDGDVDWFQLDVAAGEELTVVCGSRTAGSGIQDLSAAVFDSTGTMMQGVAATETATEVLAIEGLAVTPGNYLVRIQRGAQDAEVTGDWVRCGFIAAPPPMMP